MLYLSKEPESTKYKKTNHQKAKIDSNNVKLLLIMDTSDTVISELTDKICLLYNNLFAQVLQISSKNLQNDYIDLLEYKYSNFYNERILLDESFITNMVNFLNEKEIIKLKRSKYKIIGIQFKTARKVDITLQAEKLIVKYLRYHLTPKTSLDAEKLLK
jgi:hypothetical protein